jgi:UDP:flavonoid glycosyltransferase YjiC (YdhE family)
MAVHVYAVAIEAVAELPVRVLLTVGQDADLEPREQSVLLQP